jgi:multidrug resistance efflux pump
MRESKAADKTRDALPTIHPGVLLHQLGPDEFVVKDAWKRAYFRVGSQEFFLLRSLRQSVTLTELKASFKHEFHEELSGDDVRAFLDSLRGRGLLNEAPSAQQQKRISTEEDDEVDEFTRETWRGKGSLFFYRVPLLDPDPLLKRMVAWFPWIWTKPFVICTLFGILTALILSLQSRNELLVTFNAALRWDTLILVGAVAFIVTGLHELAHGATCKRFGGDVHESGVLFLLLMPCLYINVSDAWLIPERWKRLSITAAGAYLDLCLWALGVLAWRLTVPGTLVNHLCFVLLTTCGTRTLINCNPLLKLDGYYFLSDLLRIPNLYSQGRKSLMGHIGWALWGSPRPQPQSSGRLLFWYGALSWGFALLFLNIVIWQWVRLAGDELGITGYLFGGLVLAYATQRVFSGMFGKEMFKMLTTRLLRSVLWIAGLGITGWLLFTVPINHYVTGDFEVRPGELIQVPTPVSCFIGQIYIEDGSQVAAGDKLIELRAPDLLSQIETKEAELRESEAKLTLLRAGPRPQEIADQEERVKRLLAWYELGKHEVETARKALDHELQALEHRIESVKTEHQYVKDAVAQSERLNRLGALAGAQLKQERTQLDILKARMGQAEADYASRATEGIRTTTAEFSRREQELADAEGKLTLLRLGYRTEEIEAEQARRERIVEELTFLESQKSKLAIVAPISGFISAPRLREKAGHFVSQGTLLCQIEARSVPMVEIFVSEDDALHVAPAQQVQIKARALPFETFFGEVALVATAAAKPQEAVAQQQLATRQTVAVHCRMDAAEGRLKSGMTGYGRVLRGRDPIGIVLTTKVYRYIRTEFWW